ncbi:MAG: ABC transporter substrate-binding protein [Anaerolineae bacterium]|jgi:peptide/nickel transport system substrate-binding protein|nr:ABC transporter substrate-binding protein [Anaerolineae bacterium]
MKKLFRIVSLSLMLSLMLVIGVRVVSAQGSTIVIGWEQEPSQLSPASDMAFASYMTNFYQRGHVEFYGNNAEITPLMITEIPTVENGMVVTTDAGATQVTYTLREGMLWSDGTPITSADCLVGHRLYSDESTGSFQRGTYLEQVASVEAVDDFTFVMTYKAAFPDYLVDATPQCGWPAHILNPLLDAGTQLQDMPFMSPAGATSFVGYGPYVISEWRVGEQVTFSRNPNWGNNPWEQAPAIDNIVTRFIFDASQMRNALEVGDIDMAFNWPVSDAGAYNALADTFVWSTPGVFQDALWLNMQPTDSSAASQAMADVNIRKALIHALDRQKYITTLLDPDGTLGIKVPANYFHPNWVPEDVQPLAYDPDLALDLFADAGWTDTDGDGVLDDGNGNPFLIRAYTTTAQIRLDFLTLMQADLAAIGVTMQFFGVPGGTVLFASYEERGIISTGDFDMTLFALSFDPLSPNITPEWFTCDAIRVPGGSNGYGFCNPDFDALIPQIATTVDATARAELYHSAARLLSEGQFWHGLFPRNTFYAVNSAKFNPDSMVDMGVLTGNYFNRVEYWTPAN